MSISRTRALDNIRVASERSAKLLKLAQDAYAEAKAVAAYEVRMDDALKDLHMSLAYVDHVPSAARASFNVADAAEQFLKIAQATDRKWEDLREALEK